MTPFALYLYDDTVAASWHPFSLTRPVGELLLGAYTFRQRAERVLGAVCAGHVTAPHLTGFDEHDAAPIVDLATLDTGGARLFLNSRVVLEWGTRFTPGSRPTMLRVGGTVVGWYAPADTPHPWADWFDDPSAGDADIVDVAGRVIEHVWELVSENPAQVTLDHGDSTAAAAELPQSVDTIGFHAGMLRLGRDVIIEPNVVLDFSNGPIWLDDGVRVQAFTRVGGPTYVGPRSMLLGGPFEGVSLGPVCKARGEIEHAIMLGYSNKAHDGFLGNSYLGRWVNLGAMTTSSDLKNSYGTIRLWTPDGEVDTGMLKLGCLLGDHVKTGIGALLNTGTVIGAGSNVYGTEMPPTFVPPFSWGSGADLVAFDLDKFLDITTRVMARRGITLSDAMRAVLGEAWRLGRAQA
jgi:UDP-N-acetylglucosamine diphosphorylase / glucose-1-phosphate thymidylyltransferase / UDP-N-acetylgalactosamine diphosphorylase / glucosamine-1-phosphate N-acetyltransferase / galactosamine-1-phosphate N-acetyltransferase